MKRVLACLLCALLGLAFAMPALARDTGFKITNPYEDVVWSGAEAWSAYKGNLHTHTTFSDGTMSLADVVEAYYAQGYDVLAIADHGVAAKPWDKRPLTVPPLDAPHWFEQRPVLTSERLADITVGKGRDGRGLTQVPKAIEMNAAVVYKNHVVGLFGGWGQGWLGLDNDFRTPVRGTQRRGGLSFIAHPGDWIKSASDPAIAQDPANVSFFADILRDYPSCLGIEIYNGSDNPTRHDRVLWDQLLMRLMPDGRRVFGFANDDSHYERDIGLTADILFMPANTTENIRECLETGAFLSSSRIDRPRLGDGYVGDKTTPFPGITNIQITGDQIMLQTSDTNQIEWIADGTVIAAGSGIDLKAHADEITSYVRAQLIGPGGTTATQAFGVDKGDGYRHPDDALYGWSLVKWTLRLYLTRNPFMFIIETIGKLFK